MGAFEGFWKAFVFQFLAKRSSGEEKAKETKLEMSEWSDLMEKKKGAEISNRCRPRSSKYQSCAFVVVIQTLAVWHSQR